MTLEVRRVVTDHDDEGRSLVAVDERCPNVISRRPGHQSCVAWTGPDGTLFRIVEYQPGVAPRMHRTETIDYAVVISGEIDMVLDRGIGARPRHGSAARRRRAGAAGDPARLGEPRQRAVPHCVRARTDQAAGARRKGPQCGGLARSWRSS
jgi:hypothetical protein